MPRAHGVFVALVIFSPLAFLLAALSEPSIALNALAGGAVGLSIIQTISVTVAASRFTIHFNNARALGITGHA
jgi:hypothetical protein